jgi:hypothetical protein
MQPPVDQSRDYVRANNCHRVDIDTDSWRDTHNFDRGGAPSSGFPCRRSASQSREACLRNTVDRQISTDGRCRLHA